MLKCVLLQQVKVVMLFSPLSSISELLLEVQVYMSSKYTFYTCAW